MCPLKLYDYRNVYKNEFGLKKKVRETFLYKIQLLTEAKSQNKCEKKNKKKTDKCNENSLTEIKLISLQIILLTIYFTLAISICYLF